MQSKIIKTFNQVAQSFEKAAIMQQEVGQRLFERLDYLKLHPQYVLDLGGGTGTFSKLLAKRYPKARIMTVDIAENMLKQAQAKRGYFKKRFECLCADMHQLPFPTGLFDLVFSNQVFHWTHNRSVLLQEVARILKPEGCLMFSTLGPDTGSEIKQSWAKVDHYAHVNDYLDMHDWGDLLLKNYFLDPVMDMEYLTIHYPHFEALIKSLKEQGNLLSHEHQRRGLTSPLAKMKFQEAFHQFKTQNKQYPLTYEVLYGHAWRGTKISQNEHHEVFISLDKIQKKL